MTLALTRDNKRLVVELADDASTAAIDEIARLTEDNARLRAELRRAERKLAAIQAVLG